MNWISILNTLGHITVVAPFILFVINLIRRFVAQYELCAALGHNNFAEVRSILITYSHLLKKKQIDNATMWLMANADPIQINKTTEQLNQSNNNYRDYG